MKFTAPWDWLRRRDPGLANTRRAARVTLVACLGFYLCRYWLDNANMATYALFGVVALGMLAQIPGGPAERARTLLWVLPVGWLLVTAGTLLSVSNWSAAAGMFVLGFIVSYVGVGGPRLAGLAAGLQLLYILPCFPPYDPGSLLYRLIGLTLGVVLLAIAELVLWPSPAPVSYRQRLAGALDALAGCVKAVADGWSGDPSASGRLATLLPQALDQAEALRPSRLPPLQRPASAGRRDRALSNAAGTARLILGRTVDLYFAGSHNVSGNAAAIELLRQAAGCTEAAAHWLRGDGSLPDTDRITAADEAFQLARFAVVPDGLPHEQIRLGSLAISVGEWTRSLVIAIRIVGGASIGPDTTPAGSRPGPFWYAYQPAIALYWERLREHLTPRSVYFQAALRLAFALAIARLLAGVLDLSHGFWVLLATLTVMRTSAAETRSTLRPALIGTLIGSLVAAAFLVVIAEPRLFALALPLVMLIGFAAGPLLGLGWSQGLFTVVIAFIFAQVAPSDWHLAAARVLDVGVGAAIGALIGIFAWPRGGAGELHRATANFMLANARVVRETVSVLAESAPPGDALPQARAMGQLAEATYALYQTERHGTSRVDWQATMVAGYHAIRGAEILQRSGPGMPHCLGPLTVTAADVAKRFEQIAEALLRYETAMPASLPDPLDWPPDIGLALYHLADIRVWLDGLRDDLGRVWGTAKMPEPAQQGIAALRLRVAAVADGGAG